MKGSLSNTNNFWGSFAKSRITLASVYFLYVLIIVALLAPVIANDKPIYININGHSFFPALSGDEVAVIKDASGTESKIVFSEYRFVKQPGVTILLPLIPYAPHSSDILNSGYKSPSSKQYTKNGNDQVELTGLNKHLLGTGKRGEDVLSGLIHGTGISLTVGIFAMLIAGIIGIFLGAMAGYFGDDNLKISRGKFLMLLIGIIPAWFYAFQLRSLIISDALQQSPYAFALQLLISKLIFILVLALFYFSGNLFNRVSYMAKQIAFPLDSLVSRSIEVLISLPRLILILSIAAIARPSLVNLILIIGLTSWTDIARLTRAEMLKLRNTEFIESARSMGFKNFRIIFRHALPNAIAPALVALSFGTASAILTESALSFLGIGVPQDVATWGSLLAAGRENFSAWWLVVFPGLAIFATVTAYNLIGEGVRNAMDPRSVSAKASANE